MVWSSEKYPRGRYCCIVQIWERDWPKRSGVNREERVQLKVVASLCQSQQKNCRLATTFHETVTSNPRKTPPEATWSRPEPFVFSFRSLYGFESRQHNFSSHTKRRPRQRILRCICLSRNVVLLSFRHSFNTKSLFFPSF